jgi:hypothetical protein
MRFSDLKFFVGTAIAVVVTGGMAWADTITQTSDIDGTRITITGAAGQREAWLSSAVTGGAFSQVSGTATATQINTLFPESSSWTKEGDVNASTAGGINQYLTVTLDSGMTWGTGPTSGSWAIDPTFFSIFGSAAISMHAGNGGGDPDVFAWLITPGTTSGHWHYERSAGGGGGLSNLSLWGNGTPNNVPEAGSTLILLALGLLALSGLRRKQS